MAGLNGVLLPGGYLAPLGPLGDVLVGAGWRFEADPGQFGGANQVVLTLALLAIAWFLPNTQELMRRYRPGVGFGPGIARTRLQKILVWRPNVWSATAVVGLAMLSLLSLNRISEFLYFQF